MKIESKQKGFTLIELMIVVAIIGILASIAIPQFATFRIKAFNSASAADTKNGVTIAEGFYTDNYIYPDSAAAAVLGATQLEFLKATASTTPKTMWNISDGVSANYLKGAATGYCFQAKHSGGDKIFMASDASPAPVALTAAALEGDALLAADIAKNCATKNATLIAAL